MATVLAHSSGQAIMCTIHQPSTALLGRFDNLLLIDKGKSIYFGGVQCYTKTKWNPSLSFRIWQILLRRSPTE